MTRVRAQAAVDAYAARESGRFRRSLHTAVEISDMLALSERDLRDRARRFPDDPGGEYKELYDACVVAANALVDAYGYVTSGDGGHEAALHAAHYQTDAPVASWSRDLSEGVGHSRGSVPVPPCRRG